MSIMSIPADSQPSVRYHARILVLHPSEPLVLLQHGKAPTKDHHESLYMGDKVAGLFPDLGHLTYLQRVKLQREQITEQEWHVHYVFALVHDTGLLPEGCQWAEVGALPEDLRPLAERAFAPSPKLPWQHRGWLKLALEWADGELQRQGLTRTGAPEMVKAWQISVLYRLPTDGGMVFLKSVPDFFGREVKLTPFLHGLNPQAAPEVLAQDPERKLFLMRGAGQEKVGPEHAVQAVRLYGQLQRQTENLAESLQQLGCLDRRCNVLKTQVRELLQDDRALSHGGHLTPEQQQHLKDHLPHFERLLDDLHQSPIPSTLIHGDLHLGNVVRDGDRLTFLDWSDGALGHPFVDMNTDYLLEKDDPTEHQRLIDAYLENWTDLLPLAALRELQRKAVQAGELHRAMGYYKYITPGVPDQTEWADAHLEHLDNLLKLLNT